MRQVFRTTLPGLRTLTPARVALPTAGNSIATTEVLAFQQAHALARDAVHAPLNIPALAARMGAELDITMIGILELHSNAPDRSTYLRQPQLGRSLDDASAAQLKQGDYDVAIVIADGLSAKAVERNAIPLLAHLLPMLREHSLSIAPIALVRQGRVAVGDPVGDALGARCSLVLIGERPGLSCSSSLGAYITWAPHPSRTDADRVCVSNMHEAGLPPEEAADKLFACLWDARIQQCTGTALSGGNPKPDTALPE